MVSKVVRKALPVLQQLATSKTKQARQILKYANRDLVEAIRQCVLNVLRGVVSLSKSEQRKLARYKKRLRQFVDKKTKFRNRKQIVQKGGSWIVPLLGALIPQIVSGISSLIKNRQSNKVAKTTNGA